MDWIPEAMSGIFVGHGRQLLIAGAMAILGTLFIALVYRLRKRHEARKATSESAVSSPAMPRREVESLYKTENERENVEESIIPTKEERRLREHCPPEISRRLDALEERIRDLAMRAHS